MSQLLLVSDFINDIVHPDGKISASANFVKEHNVIEKANLAIAHARKNSFLLAFVKVGFSKNYIECPKHSPLFGQAPKYGVLKLNSWGTEFYEGLDVRPSDSIIIKHRVSALYNTSLENILTANNINTVYLAGVSTHMAITLTARELHDRDYKVVIIRDACATHNLATHEHELKSLERITTIITTVIPGSNSGHSIKLYF